MEYILTQNQVISIIQRFRNKFSYKRKPHHNHNNNKYNITENNIIFSKAYGKQCKYAKEIGKIYNKYHLVIKYLYKDNDNESEEVTLSIIMDDYQDIIKSI
jgi:hypothetical protein